MADQATGAVERERGFDAMDEQAPTPPDGVRPGFWNVAAAAPDEVAIVELDAEAAPTRSITRGELAERTNRLVSALRQRGIGPGAVVATVMHNEIDTLAVLLAGLQAGWYVVPVNYHFTVDEVAYILADSEAAAVFASPATADLVDVAAERAGIAADRRFCSRDGGAMTPIDELVASGDPRRPADRTTGWFMTYTSGTTGRPKGIKRPLSGADPDDIGLAWRLQVAMFWIDEHRRHVHLVQSPTYHTAVLGFANSALQYGHQVVMMESWSAESTLRAIERFGVTTTHMVPTQFHRLLRLEESVRAAYDVSSLTNVVHGAAPCPPEVKRSMIDWFGPVVYEYYGASEGGGTVATSQDWLERPGTVGRPWDGAAVRILDDLGDELAPGEVGTVWMKTGVLDFEYHNRPGQSDQSKRDGFFTVGDLGRVDADGYLYLDGRSSEIIITGGVNVHPSEIEHVLLAHPAVADAGVIGIADEEWGERIVAVVQLEPSAPTDGVTEELVARCRDRLAGYKVPREVVVVDRLPRDPNGKLFRRRVHEQYEHSRAATGA